MARRAGCRLTSRPAIGAIAGVVLLALACQVILSIQGSGDYNVAAPVGGNNAAPGIEALLRGSLYGYVSHQPIAGLTSILLRLPFVAIASALGASDLGAYQLGALACLLPLILCGAWLIAAPDLSTRQRVARFLAMALVLQSPVTQNALLAGHPEGVLSKTLATMAVLMAMRGRARWAALTVGLAISTKETALVALVPVMIVLPGRRREVAAITGAVMFLLCGSVWLADPDAFIRSLHGEGATHLLTPFSLLWPFSSPVHGVAPFPGARLMPLGLTRSQASGLTLLAAGAVTATWLIRAIRRGATVDPLALLLLMALLRCACDSTHEAYYWETMLVPMAVWEALRNRVPVYTFLLSLSVLIAYASLGRLAPGYLYAASTSGEVLLAVYLARQAIGLPRSEASSQSRPVPAPRWALAAIADGHPHDLAVRSSSYLGPEPMPVLCDVPSTG